MLMEPAERGNLDPCITAAMDYPQQVPGFRKEDPFLIFSFRGRLWGVSDWNSDEADFAGEALCFRVN